MTTISAISGFKHSGPTVSGHIDRGKLGNKRPNGEEPIARLGQKLWALVQCEHKPYDNPADRISTPR
jgi:hypothetical protein